MSPDEREDLTYSDVSDVPPLTESYSAFRDSSHKLSDKGLEDLLRTAEFVFPYTRYSSVIERGDDFDTVVEAGILGHSDGVGTPGKWIAEIDPDYDGDENGPIPLDAANCLADIIALFPVIARELLYRRKQAQVDLS